MDSKVLLCRCCSNAGNLWKHSNCKHRIEKENFCFWVCQF